MFTILLENLLGEKFSMPLFEGASGNMLAMDPAKNPSSTPATGSGSVPAGGSSSAPAEDSDRTRIFMHIPSTGPDALDPALN